MNLRLVGDRSPGPDPLSRPFSGSCHGFSMSLIKFYSAIALPGLLHHGLSLYNENPRRLSYLVFCSIQWRLRGGLFEIFISIGGLFDFTSLTFSSPIAVVQSKSGFSHSRNSSHFSGTIQIATWMRINHWVFLSFCMYSYQIVVWSDLLGIMQTSLMLL